ncbi:MAG: hypothetical protein H0U74_05675 [Bradymonadaceae bacterium]|nr:hypothetical protein [Lujinxingiaceae bacterium]
MSDQESDRVTTQPGLKKNELLTRQTGDGSFEFIVDAADAELTPVGVEVSGIEEQLRAPKHWRTGLIVGSVALLVVVLIGGYALFANDEGKSGSRDATALGSEEVSGFKPYGGGEPMPRAIKAPAGSRTKQVVEFEEDFDEDALHEDRRPAIPAKRDQPVEPDWALEESAEVFQDDTVDDGAVHIRGEDEYAPQVKPVLQDRGDMRINPRLLRPDRMHNLRESASGRLAPMQAPFESSRTGSGNDEDDELVEDETMYDEEPVRGLEETDEEWEESESEGY